MHENESGKVLIDGAVHLHQDLGPGLLKMVYDGKAFGEILMAANDNAHRRFDQKLFQAYEDGKHRRYTLLFTVNGGAFAVAKLLEKSESVGKLNLGGLAIGMILFTIVMSFDILMFGLKIRKQWKDLHPDSRVGLFEWPGWLVLGALWLLISVGWFLVAWGNTCCLA